MTENAPTVVKQLVQALVAEHGAKLTSEQWADVQTYLERLESTVRLLRACRLSNADEPLSRFTPRASDGT